MEEHSIVPKIIRKLEKQSENKEERRLDHRNEGQGGDVEAAT